MPAISILSNVAYSDRLSRFSMSMLALILPVTTLLPSTLATTDISSCSPNKYSPNIDISTSVVDCSVGPSVSVSASAYLAKNALSGKLSTSPIWLNVSVMFSVHAKETPSLTV